MVSKKKQKQRKILIISGIAVIVFLIFVGLFLYKSFVNFMEVIYQQNTVKIIKGFSYNNDEEVALIASAISDKTGEIVMVADSCFPKLPTDDNIIFVSTRGKINKQWRDDLSLNRVYAYNIKTKELTKLYEEQKNRLLRTVGIEGEKLILMYDFIDFSPGPCFSIWADWRDFGYLDIENPKGLKKYQVPDYQVQKGLQEKDECKQRFGL